MDPPYFAGPEAEAVIFVKNGSGLAKKDIFYQLKFGSSVLSCANAPFKFF